MRQSLTSLLGRWMHSDPTSSARGRGALYAGVGLSILLSWVVGGGALTYARFQAQAQASANMQALATSVQLTFEELLDLGDAEVRSAGEEIGRQLGANKVNERALGRWLERSAARLPLFSSLRAYDEDGDFIAASNAAAPTASIARADYFKHAQDEATRDVFAGPPLPDSEFKHWTWSLVRRIRCPDGAFCGILIATIPVERIDAMLGRVTLGSNDSIELRDPGMRLVARTVYQGENRIRVGDPRSSVPGLQAMRADADAGSYVSDDTYVDPVARTYSYHRSPKYGFVVVAGVEQGTAMGGWQRQSGVVMGLVGAFTVSALAFALVISGSWRRQEMALDRIRNSEHSLNEAMEIARLGSFVYDLRGDEWTSSEAFDQMFGIDASYPRDLVHWLKLVREDMRSDVRARVNRLMELDTPFDLEYRIVRPLDGEERWVHCACRMRHDKQGAAVAIVGTYQDITARKAAEETINKLAFFDQLTGLANRTLLLDRLRQATALTARNDHTGAVLLIDLDNFKTLNDIHGHDRGDLLLKQVAQRLTGVLRAEDTVARPVGRNTVARLGGDEFVVVLPNLPGHSEEESASRAKVVASKVLFALNETYELDGVSFVGTASIGVTLFRGTESSIEDLLKQADLAMYRAKASGRDAVCFFDADLEATVMKRAMLEGHLRRALELNQIQLHFQAQVVGDGHVTGAEVLARWNHPVLGMISPAEFIPVAEESNLILPLGHWVLETACQQLAAWSLQPQFANLTLAVNVSAQQFYQNDFVDQVKAVLAATKARPHLLKLELTESLLLRDVDEIIRKMMALRLIGVGFALDDFGTGYSSLLYLKRLPIDQLKIDQSFVRDVLVDPNDAAIARTVAALGGTLGLKVIAEGVETEAQRDFLARSGCHAYQGFFISRPLPIEGFEAFARAAWERGNEEFLAQVTNQEATQE
jgi:diguanylate cyclase (GGDEF)-like protein/PAS domain S-box-containing protein